MIRIDPMIFVWECGKTETVEAVPPHSLLVGQCLLKTEEHRLHYNLSVASFYVESVTPYFTVVHRVQDTRQAAERFTQVAICEAERQGLYLWSASQLLLLSPTEAREKGLYGTDWILVTQRAVLAHLQNMRQLYGQMIKKLEGRLHES